jgi:hypothetical protein
VHNNLFLLPQGHIFLTGKNLNTQMVTTKLGPEHHVITFIYFIICYTNDAQPLSFLLMDHTAKLPFVYGLHNLDCTKNNHIFVIISTDTETTLAEKVK